MPAIRPPIRPARRDEDVLDWSVVRLVQLFAGVVVLAGDVAPVAGFGEDRVEAVVGEAGADDGVGVVAQVAEFGDPGGTGSNGRGNRGRCGGGGDGGKGREGDNGGDWRNEVGGLVGRGSDWRGKGGNLVVGLFGRDGGDGAILPSVSHWEPGGCRIQHTISTFSAPSKNTSASVRGF